MYSCSFCIHTFEQISEHFLGMAEKHDVGMSLLPQFLLWSYVRRCRPLELHHEEYAALEERVVWDALAAVVLVLPAVPSAAAGVSYALLLDFVFYPLHIFVSLSTRSLSFFLRASERRMFTSHVFLHIVP